MIIDQELVQELLSLGYPFYIIGINNYVIDFLLKRPINNPTDSAIALYIQGDISRIMSPSIKKYYVIETKDLIGDLLRYNFTIESLALSVNSSGKYIVLDPTTRGMKDLKSGTIDLIRKNNSTIDLSNDQSALFSAAGLVAEYNFRISGDLWEVLHHSAPSISRANKHAIGAYLHEWMGLKEINPAKFFRVLQDLGVLQYIIPELSALKKNNNDHYKDIFEHSLQVLEAVSKRSDNVWLRWAALLHDIGKGVTKRYDPEKDRWTFYDHDHVGAKMVFDIFDRLDLSDYQNEVNYVSLLIDMHMRLQTIANNQVTDSAVRRLITNASGHIEDLLILSESDITTKNLIKKQSFLYSYKKVREMIKSVINKDFIREFKLEIDGNDIMKITGLGPGYEVGRYKDELKNAVINNKVPNDKESLKEYLRRYLEMEKLNLIF